LLAAGKLPGNALIELIGWFGLGLRVVLAPLMKVAALHYRNTRLSALGQSE